MIVLGIEASAREGSVALVNGANEPIVLAALRIAASAGAGRLIAPTIERLLNDNRIELAAISLIATGLGPGGYTGARLAVATARTLGFALKKPVLGIESTAAIAARPDVRDGDVFVALDAKNGDVYAARYRKANGEITTLVAPFVAPAARAALLLGEGDFVAGDGLPRIAAIAPSIEGDPSLEARAEEVAQLAVARHRRGESDDLPTLLPLYLRVSEAERLWAARRAAKLE